MVGTRVGELAYHPVTPSVAKGGIRAGGQQMRWDRLGRDDHEGVSATRAKVPGGWMVFVIHQGEPAGALFYRDPNHRWDGETLPEPI